MPDSPSQSVGTRARPVVLCILDGWGHREASEQNAIRLARTPNVDRFLARCPHALLASSAGNVGLPEGQMGDSEVGHTNIGAGRVVMQDLPRIGAALADGSLTRNPALKRLIARLRDSGGACHLMGLVSPGGVHSHQDHLVALAQELCAAGVPVAFHAFLDGRDTPPKSAHGYAVGIADSLTGCDGLRFATVTGRYYAMDRDKRWERVALAYRTLVEGEGLPATDIPAAIADAYRDGESDEFVKPRVIAGYTGIKDGDGLLMANFRADRVRQILTALLDPDFHGFSRPRVPRFAAALGMTDYGEAFAGLIETMFPPLHLEATLGELVSKAGLRQLRIAETEKYAHVTFFFNGGEERVFDGEDRILVPSPKVASYDQKPEMSAYEVTDRLVEAIRGETYDLIVVNYANTDMVGHSGDLAAAVQAVEAVDSCLGRVADAVGSVGGVLLITADHGNAELMRDSRTGEPHTAHSTYPVPAILVNAPRPDIGLRDGRLADVAPTLLPLLGIDQPQEMTGESLLVIDGVRAGGPYVAEGSDRASA